MVWHKAVRYFMKVGWQSFGEFNLVLEMETAQKAYEVFINPVLILGIGMDMASYIKKFVGYTKPRFGLPFISEELL